MKKQYILLILAAGLMTIFNSCADKSKIKTLIITGQNNHDWKASSPVLKEILNLSGLFSAEIITTPEKGGDMSSFKPVFSRYKLVVLDYNGDSWSEKTKTDFVNYVKNGGGVVVYHASCMAFPDWKEYNEMTGLGGWGDRNEKDGPYVYYNRNELVVDTSAGPAGTHGERLEFEIRTRVKDHPVTKGLPSRWMHANDELYEKLRGPAKNMVVLATASAAPPMRGGINRDEPMLLAITYEKGRIFNTLIGHADAGGGPAMECAGFITTFLRGAEWAATGNVTQEVPFDFPTAAGVVLRPGFREITLEETLANLGSYDIPKTTKYFSHLQSLIRKAAGNPDKLLELEKAMVKVLTNSESTVESKKLILRELSWMGSDYCVTAVKSLVSDQDLKDEASYALQRLGKAE